MFGDNDGMRALQAEYYAATADGYESSHCWDWDAHQVALEYVVGLCWTLGVRTVLDLGAGTGRAARFLGERCPGVRVVAIEPSAALIAVGADGTFPFLRGSGDRLPFPDASIDAVCATGVMHHVRHPAAVVAEMTRVARRLVVISDANRFGSGRLTARLAKLALCRAGLWPLVRAVRTRGKSYHWAEGDGPVFSYSVYDSLGQLNAWANRVILMPTNIASTGWAGPLLSASSVMVAAIREPNSFATASFSGARTPPRAEASRS